MQTRANKCHCTVGCVTKCWAYGSPRALSVSATNIIIDHHIFIHTLHVKYITDQPLRQSIQRLTIQISDIQVTPIIYNAKWGWELFNINNLT